MPVSKERRKTLAQGGLQVGRDGDYVSELLFGTVDVICPSAAASSVVTNSATISGLDADAELIAMVLSPSDQGQMVLTGASVTAANTITASFLNPTGGDISTSATFTLGYIAWS